VPFPDLTATPGGAASNTYATAGEADAVASYRVGGSAWTALTANQKAQALVTATRQIDALEQTIGFKGERATDTQALEWPRTGTEYASTVLPAPLVSATIELAISYTPAFAAGATVDVLNPAGNGNLKRKKTDVLEKEYFAPSAEAFESDASAALAGFPPIVQRLLAALVRIPAVAGWGSSLVYRAS